MGAPAGFPTFVPSNNFLDTSSIYFPPNGTQITFSLLYGDGADGYVNHIYKLFDIVTTLKPRTANVAPGVTQKLKASDGFNTIQINVVAADSVYTLDATISTPANGTRWRFTKYAATTGKVDFKNDAATLLGTLPAASKGWHEFEYQSGLGGWNISAWGGGATVP